MKRLPAPVAATTATAITAVTATTAAASTATASTAASASATAAAVAATTASTTTIAASASSSAATFTRWTGFVYHNVTAHEIMAVKSLNGAVGFFIALDLDKSEPAWLPGKTVAHQGDNRRGDSRLGK